MWRRVGDPPVAADKPWIQAKWERRRPSLLLPSTTERGREGAARFFVSPTVRWGRRGRANARAQRGRPGGLNREDEAGRALPPTQALEQGGVCFEGEGWKIIQREPTDGIGIVACCQHSPGHRSGKPDPDGQLGGVMEVRGHKHDIADLRNQAGLFEEFTRRRCADLFAVVDESRRD